MDLGYASIQSAFIMHCNFSPKSNSVWVWINTQ